MLPKSCRMQSASTHQETKRLSEHMREKKGALPLMICLGARLYLRQKHGTARWQCVHFGGAPQSGGRHKDVRKGK